MRASQARRSPYVPFDCPAYDFYGGDRKGDNLFGNTVVVIDAQTGKMKWYFQTVHHDIWDYDSPAGPCWRTWYATARRFSR